MDRADNAKGEAVTRERTNLSSEVEGVFREFRTCEFSTLARDGTPIAWPTLTLWQPEEDRFPLTTSVTLVIGGGRDRFYPTGLFRETAEGIPDGRLVIYEGRTHGGTFADKRFGRDVVAFLAGSYARIGETRASGGSNGTHRAQEGRTKTTKFESMPVDRSGEAGAGTRELLGREWRVISSGKRSPLPLRLAKWAVFIAVTRRLYGTKWFWAWIIFGLPLAGVATHLLYRHKTRVWTRPWGGWNDVEAVDAAGRSGREEK